MSVGRQLLLLLPFGFVTWVHWMVSVQHERKLQVMRSRAPTLKERELIITRRGRFRWARRNLHGLNNTPGAASLLEGAVPEVSDIQAGWGERARRSSKGAACPASRKPYHVLLTATAQVYQQWQCRVMYFHWKKQRTLDPAGKCTEMTGFSRLVATPGGKPDGLEAEIPSIFVKEYEGFDMQRFHGYRVINRPHSVVQLLGMLDAWTGIVEDFVYIAETDHILMHPIPNKADLGSPMAYVRLLYPA